MSENPFIFGKPVKKENFYNRQEEIEMAVGFIKKLQSFSVVGERRIGKTSFLEHILSKEVMQEQGIDPEKYVMICFSLGSLIDISPDTLIESINEKIREKTEIEMECENIFDKLKVYIEKLAINDKKVVIAFDEFEIIAPILDYHFSYWLRFIFQSPNIMAITASHKTIWELGKSDGRASPLFNIFINLRLGLFSRTETEAMIKKMFQKGKIELEEKEISFLANLSGGNPYFVQLFGHYYYEEKKKTREIIHSKFENDMLDHAEDQFEGYWKHLTEEERKLLFHVESSKNDPISYNLEKKGFLVRENQKLEMFSPLFCRFINSKIHRPRKEEVLVRMSLSMLLSLLVLEALGRNAHSLEGFPEIFTQRLDASIQIPSLIIFFTISFLFFLAFKRIKKTKKLKQIKQIEIFSRKKHFIYISLVFIAALICYTTRFQNVSWNLFAEVISVAIAYYFLKIPD